MKNLKEQIDLLMEETIQLRRRIHQNPELGMKEFETTALIQKTLQECGIEIEDWGMDTGVSAIIRGGKPGKTIALRADIDALPMSETSGLPFASKRPGICHSCGHDINTACMLLVGKVLQGCRAELEGNVRLFFQPAEELGLGAKYMIEKGAFTKEPVMDQIIGCHVYTNLPAGHIGLIKGPALSGCDIIHITVHGVGGHGARPSECVDPIVAASYLIAQLQTLISRETSPFRSAVLTFGKIAGGTAPNIIPETVTFSGTLRTFDDETRTQLKEAIVRTCKLHCESMRATADVVFENGLPPLIHDAEIIDQLEIAAKETIGEDHIIFLSEPNPASDDFAEFLSHCPGVRYAVGTRTEDPKTHEVVHNPNVVFDESAIRTAALVTCQYVLNVLK